jgi:hypothetical protein
MNGKTSYHSSYINTEHYIDRWIESNYIDMKCSTLYPSISNFSICLSYIYDNDVSYKMH